MSASLVFQQYDNVIIGADTAISTKVNDKLYRLSTEGKKLFITDTHQIIFCSGDLKTSYEIMDAYNGLKNKNIYKLQNICKGKTVSKSIMIEIIVAEYNFSKKKVDVFQVSSYNNFSIIEKKIKKNELAILTAGIKTKECFKNALDHYDENPNIRYIYSNTFGDISFEGIGGDLVVYQINKHGIKQIMNTKIKEKQSIKYIDDIINKNLIVAEQIYGKIVGSNKLIITNMNDEGESSFLVDKNHMKAINMDLSLEGNNNKNRIFLNPKIGIKLQKRDGLGYPWEDVIFLDGNDGSVWAKSFHVINTNSVLDDKGLRIDNGCIWINNENGDDIFNVNTDGEVDANGRFRVFRYDNSKNKIWLADLYKDESNGGKLLLNDWDGNINAFLGSAPDYTYTGGFLKLYNGDTTKERIEIGTQSLNDMGIMRIKNNESKKIVELTGSDTGGTIRLNNKLEQTKLFMSSQDEELNQGIIKLYGEDNNAKIMIKAKSSTDNMSGIVSGDRKTGGLIQFNSYDNTSKYFITVNNENNFGMYSEKGDAFEINKSANRCMVYHNSNRHIKLSDTDIVMGFNIIQGEGTDYHNKAIIVNDNQIVIKFNDNNYITLDANGITVKGNQINLN